MSTEVSEKPIAAAADDDDDDESPNVSEANIEKAMRFWKHSSLQSIPSDQKRQYLRERGVTDQEVFLAWERIATLEETSSSSTSPASSSPKFHTSSEIETTHPPNAQQPRPQHLNSNSTNNYHPNYPAPTYPSSSPPPYYGQQHAEFEPEGPLTMVQGASLVTLGGFIGLAAAAGSRWLNGGDFHLFPKPSSADHPRMVSEQRSLFLQRLESKVEDDEEEEDDDDDDDNDESIFLQDNMVDQEIAAALVQEKLLQQVEIIAENLKANVQVQEKVLQKLSSQGTSLTDQSMNFLRQHESSSKEQDESTNDSLTQESLLRIWKELVELRADLKVHSTSDDKDTTTLFANLNRCLEQINSVVRSKEESKAVEVIEIQPTVKEPLPSITLKQDEPDDPPTDESTNNDNVDNKKLSLTLRDSIRILAEQNDDATQFKVGCQLLYLYIINLTKNRDNPRYRKIFTCNDSFQKVMALKGGEEFLLSVGFSPSEGFLEWLPNDIKEGHAIQKLNEAAEALELLKSGTPSKELTTSVMAVLSSEK
jgi:hypothetical protein